MQKKVRVEPAGPNTRLRRCPIGHDIRLPPSVPTAALLSKLKMTRRSFDKFALIAVGATIEASTEVFVKVGTKVWEDWQKDTNREYETSPDTRAMDAKAEDVFQGIFGLRSDITSISLGHENYPTSTHFHPDNESGGKTLSKSLGLAYWNIDSNKEVEIAETGDILIVGGSTSTPHTRIALQFDGPSNDELNRPEKPIIPLTYFGLSDIRQVKRQAGIKMEGVGPVVVPNWYAICTDSRKSRREIIPEVSRYETVRVSRGGNIEDVPVFYDNYIIVTRIPNFLSLDLADFMEKEPDMRKWPSMLIFSGMNGIGTRALELLTQPMGLEILQSVKDMVCQSPAFQLLFRVSDIKLTEVKVARISEESRELEESVEIIHKAHKIELFDEPAFIPLTPDICRQAQEYAVPRLHSYQNSATTF